MLSIAPFEHTGRSTPNQKLRAARLERCWTQAFAAEQVQVSIEAYSRWEYGEQHPRLSSLRLLCQAFGKSPQELGYERLTLPRERAEHYISLDVAANQLGVARGTVHYYLRTLHISTHKFPLDRRAYLAVSDFKKIKTFKEQAGKGGRKSAGEAL